jgi:tetratricopeptide (TPR) repeat protein
MERLLSFVNIAETGERARSVSRRLGFRFERVYDWLRDKSREIRSLPQDENLIRAVFSTEKAPIEGARYGVGENIIVNNPDGAQRRFRVCGIQSGGFANVYSVIDLDEMIPYSVKGTRDTPGNEAEKNRRLETEAFIALRLAYHPNLVEAQAAYTYRGRLLMVSEFVSGTSLDQRLKAGPIPLKTALRYASEICRGIIHARLALPGFVHGDIKPGNCLLMSDGTLKLGDFGLASADGIGKHRTSGERMSGDVGSISRSGWGGTTPYMAPEMFDRDAPDRSRADMYAFGVTLFEMLCGTRPFNAPTKPGIIELHLNEPAPLHLLRERNVPSNLIDLIGRCLEKTPDRRLPSFELVNELLQAAARTLAAPAEIVSSEESDGRAIRRVMSFATLGHADAARSSVEKAIELAGATPELLAAKALVLLAADRLEQAYAASTSALMIGADRFVVLLAHARVLEAKGYLETAETYAARAVALQPSNYVALNLLADLLKRNGRLEEATSYYNLARKVSPDQPKPLEGLAELALDRGRIRESIKLAAHALSLDPSRADSYRIIGDAYARDGKEFDALANYKKALSTPSPSKTTVRRYLELCGRLMNSVVDPEDARLTRLLIRCARSAGLAAVSPGRLDRLAADVRASLRGGPLLVFFLDYFILLAADETDEVVADGFRHDLKLILEKSLGNETRAHIMYSLGRCLFGLGDVGAARDCFRDVLDRFGPDEMAYYYLAACAEVGEEYEAARDFYKQALRMRDCDDTRSGIRRTSAILARSKKSIARNRVELKSAAI